MGSKRNVVGDRKAPWKVLQQKIDMLWHMCTCNTCGRTHKPTVVKSPPCCTQHAQPKHAATPLFMNSTCKSAGQNYHEWKQNCRLRWPVSFGSFTSAVLLSWGLDTRCVDSVREPRCVSQWNNSGASSPELWRTDEAPGHKSAPEKTWSLSQLGSLSGRTSRKVAFWTLEWALCPTAVPRMCRDVGAYTAVWKCTERRVCVPMQSYSNEPRAKETEKEDKIRCRNLTIPPTRVPCTHRRAR